MLKKRFSKILAGATLLAAECLSNTAFATSGQALVVGNEGNIYSFDPDHTQIQANFLTNITNARSIAVLQDNVTAYITADDDVYMLDTKNNYAVALITTIPNPHGIAISNDQKLAFVTSFSNDELYYFSITGSDHTATLVINTGGPGPVDPEWIAIDQNNIAYISDNSDGSIYQVTFNWTGNKPSGYTAKLIQDGSIYPQALTISNNYLYYAINNNTQVFNIPLGNPTQIPVQVASSSNSHSFMGLAGDETEDTMFVACYEGGDNGVYSFLMGQDSPQTLQSLNQLNIPDPISIAIFPGWVVNGERVKAKTVLQKLTANKLSWQPVNGVVSYNIYEVANGINNLIYQTQKLEFFDFNINHDQSKQYLIEGVDNSGYTISSSYVTVAP